MRTMLKRQFILVALVALLPIAACSDSTGPEAEFAGTYTLVEVNGHELPALIYETFNEEFGGTVSFYVDDGFFRLHSNGRFEYELESRAVIGQLIVEEPVVGQGVYTVTGTIRGDELTVSVTEDGDIGTLAMVFRR